MQRRWKNRQKKRGGGKGGQRKGGQESGGKLKTKKEEVMCYIQRGEGGGQQQ